MTVQHNLVAACGARLEFHVVTCQQCCALLNNPNEQIYTEKTVQAVRELGYSTALSPAVLIRAMAREIKSLRRLKKSR